MVTYLVPFPAIHPPLQVCYCLFYPTPPSFLKCPQTPIDSGTSRRVFQAPTSSLLIASLPPFRGFKSRITNYREFVIALQPDRLFASFPLLYQVFSFYPHFRSLSSAKSMVFRRGAYASPAEWHAGTQWRTGPPLVSYSDRSSLFATDLFPFFSLPPC